MKPERQYPRYDIKVVTRGDAGYAAFLLDLDSGDSWIFDRDLTWKKDSAFQCVCEAQKAQATVCKQC